MTGDGVDDAPALRQAGGDIAVSGVPAVVLAAPGLGVIIRAVEEARRIFGHLTSDAIYGITEALRIMPFGVFATRVCRFFPITPLLNRRTGRAGLGRPRQVRAQYAKYGPRPAGVFAPEMATYTLRPKKNGSPKSNEQLLLLFWQ